MASKSKTKSEGKSKKSSKGAPKTMEDLLALYEADVVGYSVGDKVKGKVVSKDKKRVVIDIAGKSEGIVAEKAFKEAESFIKKLDIGDEVQATVLVPETQDGFTILSLRHAAEDASWEKLLNALNSKSEIVVEGKSVNSSGVMVSFDNLTGFIPNSQLGREAHENKQSLVDSRIKVRVKDVDRSSNKIVFSEKEVSEKEDIALAKEAIKHLKEDEIYGGEVTTVYDFGCFVKIKIPVGKEKASLEGLVHISEMSWDKVDKPTDVVSEGDKVKVKIIGNKDGKLALSMKQTKQDPWDDIEKKYKKDQKVKGKVVKTSDFGVFVQLEPGVEGLIHMTKIPPGTKLNEGDEIKVYIEEVSAKERRISLGLVLTQKPVGYK